MSSDETPRASAIAIPTFKDVEAASAGPPATKVARNNSTDQLMEHDPDLPKFGSPDTKDFSIDDDSDDDSKDEGGVGSNVTDRTSKILSEYRSYLYEMEGGSDKEGKKAAATSKQKEGDDFQYLDYGRKNSENNYAFFLDDADDNSRDGPSDDILRAHMHSLKRAGYTSRKKGVLVLGILVAVIVAVTVGIVTSTRSKDDIGSSALQQEDTLESEAAPGDTSETELDVAPPDAESGHTTIEDDVLLDTDPALFESIQLKFRPAWFDRSHDWYGKTYDEALQFCASKASRVPCPYEAICPMGPLSVPFEGHRYGGNGESWVPTIDSPNSWVKVSSDDQSCVTYNSAYNEPPSWGLTGEGSEEITRHVLCCKTPSNDSIGSLQEVTDSSLTTPAIAFTSPPLEVDPDLAKRVEAEYRPDWFDRAHDWSGQTYVEAIQFCDARDSRIPCPYEAICPMGPNSVPLEGHRDEPGESWVPIIDAPNAWVQVSSSATGTSCVKYDAAYNQPPSWGLTGEGNEELTRYVMCCKPPPNGFNQVTAIEESDNVGDTDTSETVVSQFQFESFDRSSGWVGRSYSDGLEFCASRESRIPCFYDAICPNGLGSVPTGGYREGGNESWVPIIDSPNGWVQVGTRKEGCVKYNTIHNGPPFWGLDDGEDFEEITRHIMCCKDPYDDTLSGNNDGQEVEVSSLTRAEEEIMNNLRPIWFGREHGYYGTTHDDAVDFCNKIAEFSLCPLEAYCPDGPKESGSPMFLMIQSFEDEQWAPLKAENSWVFVGTSIAGQPSETCLTYDQINGESPPWGVDGLRTNIKKHIMCCMPEEMLAREVQIEIRANPVWLNDSHGWKGGSYEDALALCEKYDKKLCPIWAYCPHGAGQPVIGKHTSVFDAEGEQWAPLDIPGASNEWVMIGQKFGNSATTCMTHEQLEGGDPDWGLNDDRASVKKHVMCCSTD